MLFSLFKHYLEFYITNTALKVSKCLYCFTTSISHGVEQYFPRLWGTGIFDAIFSNILCMDYFIPNKVFLPTVRKQIYYETEYKKE